MSLIGLDVRHLRAFVTVAAELNFVRAAKRLHVSQPALSHTIRQLEAILGLQLFKRDTRHVELTPSGSAIVGEVTEILDRLESLGGHARHLAAAQKTRLRVGYLIGAAIDIVPRIMQAFGERHPNIAVSTQEFDFTSPEAGIGGDTDVSIVRPPIGGDRLQLLTLFEEECVVCLPADHRLSRLPSVRMAQILDEPIVAAPGAGVWRDYWLGCDFRAGTPPKVVCEAPTFESEFHAVACGRGISITPLAASRFYARPGLAFRRIDDMPLCRVAVALPHQPSPAALMFAKLAVSVAAAP